MNIVLLILKKKRHEDILCVMDNHLGHVSYKIMKRLGNEGTIPPVKSDSKSYVQCERKIYENKENWISSKS